MRLQSSPQAGTRGASGEKFFPLKGKNVLAHCAPLFGSEAPIGPRRKGRVTQAKKRVA